MKNLIFPVIAVFAFTVSVSGFDAVHGEKYYAVKAAVAYKGDSVKCREMCRKLQKDGIMAYCVKGKKANETFAGAYSTKAEADKAAAALSAKYGMICVVEETSAVSKTKYKGGEIVNVPSGVWLVQDGKERRIFAYGHCVDVRDAILENQASVSPSGREIVFYFNGAIHRTDIATGRDNVIAEGLTNPGSPCRPEPRWSPDGSKIAYITQYGRGKAAGITVMNSDGSGAVCLVDNKGTDRHVASLEWGSLNSIYFVETPAKARVSVDGKLCMVDMSGQVTDIIKPSKGNKIDRHFKIQGKTIIYSVNQYEAGLDDNYASIEKRIELN